MVGLDNSKENSKNCIICFYNLAQKTVLFSSDKTFDLINDCSNLLELSQDAGRELRKIFFESDLKIAEFFCVRCSSLIEKYKKRIEDVERKGMIDQVQKMLIEDVKLKFIKALENNHHHKINENWLEAAKAARKLILIDLCYWTTETNWKLENYLKDNENHSAVNGHANGNNSKQLANENGQENKKQEWQGENNPKYPKLKARPTPRKMKENLGKIAAKSRIIRKLKRRVGRPRKIIITNLPALATNAILGKKKEPNFYMFPLDVDYRKCKSCSKEFNGRMKYFEHQFLYHEGQEYFNCDDCNEILGTFFKLEAHKIKIHGKIQKKYTCLYCGKEYLSGNKALRNHIDKEHNQGNLDGNASKNKENPENLGVYPIVEIQDDKEEESAELSPKLVKKVGYKILGKSKISHAGFGLKKGKTIQKSVYNLPYEMNYKLCTICGQKFRSRVKFQGHQFRFHGGAKYFNCDQCNVIEGSVYSIAVHKVKFHGKDQKKY